MQNISRISITGDPGSGKSTFARAVSELLGYRLITMGNIFRQLAADRGVTITQLNQMAEVQKELDAQLDDYLIALNDTDEPLVLDSRVAWHFVKDTFKVRLTVDPDVAVKRIFSDTTDLREKFATLEEGMEEVEKRKQSEIKRYQKLYGINIGDDSNFDLVINTSHTTREETLQAFKDAFGVTE